MKRTLENCVLVRRYGAPRQYDGKCEGFQRSTHDDEPCATCIKCPLQYINAEERVTGNIATEGSGNHV